MPSYVGSGGSSVRLRDLSLCVLVSVLAASAYLLFRTQLLEIVPDVRGLPLARTSLDWNHQIASVAVICAIASLVGARLGAASPWGAVGGLGLLSVGAVTALLYLRVAYGIVVDVLPAIVIPAAVLSCALLRENLRKDRAMFIKEMALLHKDTLLKSVFENTYDGIFVANENGDIVYANRSGLGLFGYNEGELVGRPLDVLVPAAKGDGGAKGIDYYLRLAKLENRQVGPFQTVGRRRDGKILGIDLTVGTVMMKRANHPMERRKRDRLLFVCNIWDSAVRGRLETIHRQGVEDDIMTDRAMAEFVANISHELRTPLNAIIGFSELLGTPALGPLSEKQREYAQDINESAGHLLRIINDILDISKIESGNTDLREEEVDIAELVTSCIKLVGYKAKKGEVDVRAVALPDTHRLYADERMMKQVLINLLSNAVKFTPSGGDVEVGATVERDGSVTLSVSDSGIGIPAKDIPLVLAPFGQVQGGLDRKYEGTGLGLPLAKRLVEVHGGTLAIRSFVGIGTTVTVSLPSHRVRQRRSKAAG